MCKPSNSKIEDRAIGALRSIIDIHLTMGHQFNSMDKEMSWDGFIWLYKNKLQDKRNFDDKIPVQIKGHIDENKKYINKKRINYPVYLDDLQVYFQDRGVLYFQIFMSNDGTESEIFYTSLFSTKNKRYLEKAKNKGNKKSINILFTKLEKKADKIYYVVKQFSNESKKQGFGTEQIVQNAISVNDMDKIKEIKASAVGCYNYFDILKRIGDGDVSFYGIMPGSQLELPIEWHENSTLFLGGVVNNCVCIADKQYYNRYQIRASSKEFILKLSDNLQFNITENKFSFKAQTIIKELRNDAEFLLTLMNHTEITIGDITLKYSNLNIPKGLRDELQFYIDLDDTLSMIEFKYDKPFKEISDSTLKFFSDIVAIKKGLKNNNLPNKIHSYNPKVDDKYIPLIIIKKQDGEENMLFNTIYSRRFQPFISNDNDEHFKVPVYAYIEPNIISNLYEFKYDYFYEQINDSDINDFTADIINQSALTLIHAYDSVKDKRLLEIALYTLDKMKSLQSADNNNNYTNKLQIKKRLGSLNEDDISYLNDLESEDLQLLCAKSTLLDNKPEAKKHYNQMTAEIKKLFKSFPIYTLYKQL